MLSPSSDPLLLEARTTTRRVGRTFALACRLLPRDVRDDVYLLYLVFRTLDDLVDERRPGALAAIEAVERWCDAGVVSSREAALLADLDARHGLPRGGAARLLRRHARGPRGDADPHRGRARPLLPPRRRDRRPRHGRDPGDDDAGTRGAHAAALGKAMQRTNILRDIDEDAANGRVYLARRRSTASAAASTPAAARRCCATRSRAPTRSTSSASPASRCCAAAAARSRRPAGCTARSCARSSARATARAPGRAVVSRPRKLLVAARARAPLPT